MMQNEGMYVDELLKEMTLKEKVSMIHGSGLFRTEGIERLGIPPLITSDGPMGVRNEFEDASWKTIGNSDDFVTYLPSNTALAATFNRELAYEAGKVLGCEARGRGKDVILAPGINIQRSPLCGRNFEYMSEDPKLIEEIVVPFIQGIQENDVAACVKHFAANNQEIERLWVDTYMDERTLREIYLPGFYAAISKGNSYTLMGAYNRLFGEHCSESKYLLTKVLREEWGYDGTVISDWGAVHNTKNAAESSLDIEMSVTDNFNEYFMADPLIKAVENGEISEEHIDKKVKNILRLMYRLKMIGSKKEERMSGTYNTPKHHEVVLNTAREAIVLLKNEEKRLPIKTTGLKKIAVIGHNAEKVHANGGGSSEIKALYEISPLMGIKKLLGGNVKVEYAKGYYVPEKKDHSELNWQEASLLSHDEAIINTAESVDQKMKERMEEIKRQQKLLREEAVALAKKVDEVIIVGGLNHDYDCEGWDRSDLLLPYAQEELINAVLEVNANAVIVMITGAPVSYQAFVNKAKAILWTSYIGMEGGTALAEVLFGQVNPSGKLPMTIPKSLNDSPAHVYGEYGTKESVTYKEGLLVGYRYFDTKEVEPEFCFGHGLSYTTFECKDLLVSVDELTNENDLRVSLSMSVKNTGDIYGGETIQVYIKDMESSLIRPVHELKEFKKVFLAPSKEETICFELHKEAFSFYDDTKSCFVVEPGKFIIEIASSSRDVSLQGEITIENSYTYTLSKP
ncbi:beta-glucosidase [Clostridium sp. Marseille-P299]|uniref:beta-glucosidase n=1 Tax=Clostridium sp. Marseille-P299 TaxID=1805477 RepID=UPI0008379BFA|nr:glycoside hydrolase family 3 C-terminal domain-containing protein [Clostridium sp. Marseille-P299]